MGKENIHCLVDSKAKEGIVDSSAVLKGIGSQAKMVEEFGIQCGKEFERLKSSKLLQTPHRLEVRFIVDS